MATKPQLPAVVTGVTNADRTRLLHLIDHARESLPDDDLSFLQTLADDLPRVKSMLPEPMRRIITELDNAQGAFETSWAAVNQVLADATERVDTMRSVNVRDRQALQDVAEMTNQLAQSAAEVALRAQALDTLIGQYYPA